MAIDQFLLDILVCPDDKSAVKPISASAVQFVNGLIRQGKIKNRGGSVVSDTIEGGLVRADKKILYPVRSDIPVMLVDEGLSIDGIALPS